MIDYRLSKGGSIPRAGMLFQLVHVSNNKRYPQYLYRVNGSFKESTLGPFLLLEILSDGAKLLTPDGYVIKHNFDIYFDSSMVSCYILLETKNE